MSKWLEALVMARPPRLLHQLLPGCEWTGPATATAAPVLYLTFDDGPIPEETPWVLEQLAEYHAKATFFCVGENVARYPEIARAVRAAGHRLGHHTYHHISAWQTRPADYLAEVRRGHAELSRALSVDIQPGEAEALAGQPSLFRPPYGRLTRSLSAALRPDYRLIMWSVLTRDYDPHLPPEDCLRRTMAAVRPNDIVVFHDSRKASPRLRYVLPRLLAHCAARGYRFETL